MCVCACVWIYVRVCMCVGARAGEKKKWHVTHVCVTLSVLVSHMSLCDMSQHIMPCVVQLCNCAIVQVCNSVRVWSWVVV